jgi:putative transposase
MSRRAGLWLAERDQENTWKHAHFYDRAWSCKRQFLPFNVQLYGTPVVARSQALFYIDKTGCQWQMLSKDLPNYGTVHYYFRKWTNDGTFARINTDLRRMLRARYGREPDPSLAIVDSQSVKTTAVGGM